MPRHPTSRPITEHLALLTRIFGQVSVSKRLKDGTKKEALRLLKALTALFQKALSEE